MLKKIVLVVAALLVFQSTANAALYRWVDEKGNVNYSNQPQPPAEAATPAPPADDSRPRSFPLPQHGHLILSVPQSWDHEVRQAPENLPPTIVLTPRDGDDFKVMITPLWNPKNEPGFNNPQFIKGLVSNDLKGMLPTAVERDVQIQEFQGKQGPGYYFQVTDKDPGPTFPYAVRAGLGVGDLLLSVTILSRSKDSEAVRQALKALQGAVQLKN